MSLDKEVLMSKSAYIREQVQSIKSLVKTKPKNHILEDPWVFRGLKYSLQTAIEAMIDMAYHVSTKHLAHAPTDARDALGALAQNGILSADEMRTFKTMVGFRNRLVHGYEGISPDQLYDIAVGKLDDFEVFLIKVLGLLK